MGQRKLRRVPPNWKHPKGRSLFDGPWEEKAEAWDRKKEAFDRGEEIDGSPLPAAAIGCSFEEWNGERPKKDDYMPSWPDAERTHFQMYETCSEGTPISPVLESPEAVARWCAENGASAFGYMTQSYEWWLKVCHGEAGFGLLLDTSNRTMTLI